MHTRDCTEGCSDGIGEADPGRGLIHARISLGWGSRVWVSTASLQVLGMESKMIRNERPAERESMMQESE